MTEDNYVVQLGLKRNGRFVKNEEYSLGDFMSAISAPNIQRAETPKFLTRLIWLFNRKYVAHAFLVERNRVIRECHAGMLFHIRTKIDKDEFGKKK